MPKEARPRVKQYTGSGSAVRYLTMPRATIQQLETRRKKLKAELAKIGEMRPGSLVERFRKCGKFNCHCADPESSGHGPSWSLTREVKGKTVTKIIPPEQLERTKAQVAEYRRFRLLSRQLVELSERICAALNTAKR